MTFPSVVLCSQLSYEVDDLVVTDWAQRSARSAAKASHRTLVSLNGSRACLPYQIQCASGMLAATVANSAAQKLAAAIGDQNYRYCSGADMLAAQAASSAAQKLASASRAQEHRYSAGANASCSLLAGVAAVSAAVVEAPGGSWFSDAPGVLSASWAAERLADASISVAQPAVVDFAQLRSDALAALVPDSFMFKGAYVQRDITLPTPLTAGLARPSMPFEGARPSELEVARMLGQLPGDYSHPLFPSRPGVNGVQHLGGPLTYLEWLHMNSAECYISTYELERGTRKKYSGGQAQFFESAGPARGGA